MAKARTQRAHVLGPIGRFPLKLPKVFFFLGEDITAAVHEIHYDISRPNPGKGFRRPFP